ncbi:hypothetical protein M5K25_016364 [Dendrobium thyrsiflorum]|uniref:Uncharacterized protein n=1 Tax=Dendrobium thyrsiflorum TaxID=117978 RepID=A0ABD0UJF9_DENTH
MQQVNLVMLFKRAFIMLQVSHIDCGSLPYRQGEKGRGRGSLPSPARVDSASDSSETVAEEEVTNLCLMADNLDHSDQEEGGTGEERGGNLTGGAVEVAEYGRDERDDRMARTTLPPTENRSTLPLAENRCSFQPSGKGNLFLRQRTAPPFSPHPVCSEVDQNVDQNESLTDQTVEPSPEKHSDPEQVQRTTLPPVENRSTLPLAENRSSFQPSGKGNLFLRQRTAPPFSPHPGDMIELKSEVVEKRTSVEDESKEIASLSKKFEKLLKFKHRHQQRNKGRCTIVPDDVDGIELENSVSGRFFTTSTLCRVLCLHQEGEKGHRFSAFAERLEKEEAVLCQRKSGSLSEEEWFSAITRDSEKDIGPLPALGKTIIESYSVISISSGTILHRPVRLVQKPDTNRPDDSVRK